MDIKQAVRRLSKAGVTLNCSTQETVTSQEIEGTIYVLIESEYEDGTPDRMQIPLERFQGLYSPQQFTEKGLPISPVTDENDS